MTGDTEQARREIIEKAVEAADESGGIRLPVLYKGDRTPFLVVKIPLSAAIFNPRSHRIRAQIEGHPKRELIEQNPLSEEAQDLIHQILVETEGFDDLKKNISDIGQIDPGVITQEGLLVNANTRLAVLRELEEEYIEAAVLPGDAGEAEIEAIEADLQYKVDLRQEYTFTNYLLFLDDMLKRGSSEEALAKKLNWAASSDEKELRQGIKNVQLHVRMLARIREIQEMSGNRIPLPFFDDKRQALIDLDGDYESLKDEDFEAAERLKYGRITAILAGSKYREMRKLDEKSVYDFMLDRLGEKDVLGPEIAEILVPESDEVEGDDGDDDLDALGGEDADEPEETSLQSLAKLVAESYGDDELELPSGKLVPRVTVIEEIFEAVDETADDVKASDKVEKDASSAANSLKAAVKKVNGALEDYKKFNSDENFNSGAFGYQLKKLKQAIKSIEDAVEKASGPN